MKTLKIKQPRTMVSLPFDRERPFLRIKAVTVNGDFMGTLDITCRITKHDKKVITEPIVIAYSSKSDIPYFEEKELNVFGAVKVEFYFEMTPSDSEILFKEIILEYEIIDRLDTSLPTTGFEKHIEDHRNVKILFSAPYGQGKTTFLEEYFRKKKDKYRVFKVYPVNFSISSNEDIFKYIKFEILFQLLGYSNEFKKTNKKYSKTFLDFFKENADKLLAPLMLSVPYLGRSAFQAFEKWTALKDEYFEYHKSLQINEELLVKDYLKSFYEQEGMIYEDNMFSQIIRQMLSKLKDTDNDVENVLLIDDLDRLDPDHIFRILNVLTAHIDNVHFGDNNGHNKFGFDRIVIVCDIENIRHIFAHRYGEKVDFSGYINKYYSTNVFEYNNMKVIEPILQNFDQLNKSDPNINSRFYKHLYYILTSMFQSNLISLRELFKLRNTSLENQRFEIRNSQYNVAAWFRFSAFTPVIMLLSKIGGVQLLKKKIKMIKPETFKHEIDITSLCLELIVSLSSARGKEVVQFKMKERMPDFRLDISPERDFSFDYPKVEKYEYFNMKSQRVENAVYEFSFDDFIDLLNENIDKYDSIKSLIK